MEKTFLEIMFYTDGSGYYNHAGVSVDFDDLKDLKRQLKEKFSFDFIKSKAVYQYSGHSKECYHIEF